jgi:serine/threonine protein kinase
MPRCPICDARLDGDEVLCPACLIRSATAADDAPDIDRIVASDWRLCSPLGAHEHGMIYLAEREHDRQIGALHLSAERVSASGVADRLEAERRRLMALEGGTIVPILDVGLTESGQIFVVFEHVRGRSLHEYLQSRRRTAHEVEGLLAKLDAAIAGVHRRGLAHGAVRPPTVVISGNRIERRALLLEMGLRHLRAQAGLGAPPEMSDDVSGLASLRDWVRAFVSVSSL